MRNEKNNKNIWACMLGIGLGRCILAILQSFLNESQVRIIAFLSILGIIIYLIVLAILKKQSDYIKILLLIMPLMLSAIGLILDKPFIIFGGLGVFGIFLIIFLINNIR